MNKQELKIKLHQVENTGRDLANQLEKAHNKIERLETAKLKIKEVRREQASHTEVLQILHMGNTPDGVVVTVS